MKILLLVTLFTSLFVSSVRAESMGNGTGNNSNDLAIEIAKSICNASNNSISGCFDLEAALGAKDSKRIIEAIKNISDSMSAPGN